MVQTINTLVDSDYQKAVYHAIEYGSDNIIVEALAGSGKTTLIKRSCEIIYNKQGVKPLAIAFGKRIQKELNEKIGKIAQVQTLNSLGHGLVRKALNYRELNVDRKKYLQIARKVVKDQNGTTADWEVNEKLSNELYVLTTFSMKTLTGTKSREALEKMIQDYNLDINYLNVVGNWLGYVVKEGDRLAKEGFISFEDQLFLPYLWKLNSTYKYAWVFGDEMQDVSSAALELFLKFTDDNTRILGVGDRWQSIMGFAGANTDALDRLKSRTNAISLPLSICYRCPKSHLRLAQKLVPAIEPSPTAIEGVIIDVDLKTDMAGRYDYEELLPHLTGGELIVCRKTAPLITLCIKLIIARVPARIIAGDSNLESSLSSLIDDISKVSGFRLERFPEFLEILFQSRQSRLIEQGAFKIIANLRDRCDALLACFEGFCNLVNIKVFKKAISALFVEREDSVTLSTIHTAKGLEAERVVFLHPELCPHTFKGQNKESLQQEANLEYVALTRSKHTLILACGSGVKKLQSRKNDDETDREFKKLVHRELRNLDFNPERGY